LRSPSPPEAASDLTDRLHGQTPWSRLWLIDSQLHHLATTMSNRSLDHTAHLASWYMFEISAQISFLYCTCKLSFLSHLLSLISLLQRFPLRRKPQAASLPPAEEQREEERSSHGGQQRGEADSCKILVCWQRMAWWGKVTKILLTRNIKLRRRSLVSKKARIIQGRFML
jgi:hypothetical protein